MTLDNLLFFAKQHIHSDHAKILLAELLNKNPLELLTCLEENVPEETVETYKISVTVRRKLGSDINASCGQLRAEENEKK